MPGAGAVLQAEGAEGPGQRIATLVVGIVVERRKARPLGQEGARADAVGDGAIAPLEQGNGWVDGGDVAIEFVEEGFQAARALPGGHGFGRRLQVGQALARENGEDEG